MKLEFDYYDDSWTDEEGDFHDYSCCRVDLTNGDKVIDDHWYDAGDSEKYIKEEMIEWLAKHKLEPVDKEDWVLDWELKEIN